MANLFVKEHTRRELFRRTGNLHQVGGIQEMRYNSGRGDDIETIEVNAGDLKFTVLKSRCLDIGQAFYKGIPLAHLSKSGLTAPKFFWKTKEREISIISMVASW